MQFKICLDLKDLNLAIKREHFQLLALEDLASKLRHTNYFSILYMESGFGNLLLMKKIQIYVPCRGGAD